MYTSYFGFSERPFNVTPDPRFFYANPCYQEAYSSLVYGVRERKGFVVLTGEVGVGKTTLLRRLMGELEKQDQVRFAFLYHPNLSFDELLSYICKDLGLHVDGADRLGKIHALNEFLLERLKAGGTVALLVDEAQNLPIEELENLRVLSNLETSNEKLLQILLVGQPELGEKLNRPELRQLKQRVSIRCDLQGLDYDEVKDFILCRLRAAGCDREDLFTAEAVQRIAQCSGGLPRLINNVCDNALLIAFSASKKTVTADIIGEVARDLRLEGVDAPPAAVTTPETSSESAAAAPPIRDPETDFDLRPDLADAIIDPANGNGRSGRIRQTIFMMILTLLLISTVTYISNPFEIQERLARQEFHIPEMLRIKDVVQFFQKHFSMKTHEDGKTMDHKT